MQEYAYISSFHNAVIGDLGRFNCEGFTGRGTRLSCCQKGSRDPAPLLTI